MATLLCVNCINNFGKKGLKSKTSVKIYIQNVAEAMHFSYANGAMIFKGQLRDPQVKCSYSDYLKIWLEICIGLH